MSKGISKELSKREEFLRLLEKNIQGLGVEERLKILNKYSQSYSDQTKLTDVLKEIEKNYPNAQAVGTLGLWSLLLKLFFIFSLVATFSLLYLYWKFTPLIEVNDQNSQIRFFGGVVDINGKNGTIKVFQDYQFEDMAHANEFTGSFDVTGNHDDLIISFKSGKVEFQSSNTSQVSWNCKMATPPNSESFISREKDIKLNFSAPAQCTIRMPKELNLEFDGELGQVTLRELASDIHIELSQGTVLIQPDPELSYRYKLQAPVLPEQRFQSFDDGIEVLIYVKSGRIGFL